MEMHIQGYGVNRREAVFQSTERAAAEDGKGEVEWI
jgi:hypothetical protein